MLKKLLSPEILGPFSSPEQGLIRSGVHKRKLDGQFALPPTRLAVKNMLSHTSEQVMARIKGWGVNRNIMAGIQSDVPKEYAEEVHRHGLNLHEKYGPEAVAWMETGNTPVPVPDDISALDTMPPSEFIEPSHAERSDRAIDARSRLATIHSAGNVAPLPADLQKVSASYSDSRAA